MNGLWLLIVGIVCGRLLGRGIRSDECTADATPEAVDRSADEDVLRCPVENCHARRVPDHRFCDICAALVGRRRLIELSILAQEVIAHPEVPAASHPGVQAYIQAYSEAIRDVYALRDRAAHN